MVLLGTFNAGAILLNALSGPLTSLGFTSSSPIPTTVSGEPLQSEPLRVYKEYLTVIDDVLEALPPYASADIDYNSGEKVLGGYCAHVNSLGGLWNRKKFMSYQHDTSAQVSEAMASKIAWIEISRRKCLSLRNTLNWSLDKYRHLSEGQFKQDRKSIKSRLVNALDDYIKNSTKIDRRRVLNVDDFYLQDQAEAARQMIEFFMNGDSTVAKAMTVTQEDYGPIAQLAFDAVGTLGDLKGRSRNSSKIEPPYTSALDLKAAENHLKAISELVYGSDFHKLHKSLLVIEKNIHNFNGAVLFAADRQSILMQRLEHFVSSNAEREFRLAQNIDWRIERLNKSLY
ncbi:hypothetical protein QQZ08_003024 [Neonectria magnoliae]|uniref:Uncharacterized protein n=1 Tax=Neonectria magnoliae TaxID=2732573 RepID=A0ABR1IBV7_9HYPO